MVKAYLRYEAGLSFGVIASLDCNICFNTSGNHLLSPALDSLGLWNLRQGVCTKFLAPNTTNSSTTSSGIPSFRRGSSLLITSIASSRDASSPSSATGHADGSIRLWDCERGACDCTLNGHKGAVTAMRFNSIGSLLASGSKDNDVILWDLVGEVGLFRLHGHHDQVTDIAFLDSGKKLVSCSKDKFMRVWDLDTQHCVQIVGGHHSEIWSLDVDPEERYLVTGSSDLEIRFYQIRNEEKAGTLLLSDKNGDTSKSEPVVGKWEVLKLFGEIQRQCKDRVATLRFNISGNLLACQAAGRIVEFYSVLGEDDSKRKAKKRIRRKEKKLAKESTEDGDDEILQDAIHPTVTVADIFKPLQVLRASKKICSVTFSPINSGSGSLATLALSLNNNTLEAYSIQSNSTTKTHTIELPGHRSDIRSLALSSDSTLLMSTSHNNVKFWNPGTGSCLRTVDSGYGLCCSFVPGNRFALVGTKTGGLEILDVGSGNRTEIEAHTDSIRSIASIPDGSGFVTGSADRDIKFWEYQLKQKSSHLLVTNVRTLKMSEDVQVVCISPDAKYIAAAILDSSVRVFFMDSLKFFLSLYGHKLPVLCMDISSDGALIVTGSADKNVKIWGLDFGDCHKSIFAHADSVMAVQFVRNTHYFFSVGKDRLLKYWDADKFELLLTLDGHHAEVWCLATSHRGDFIITGSHDRSIRRWDRTDEPFFIEEEREKRLEEMFEVDLENLNENKYAPKDELPEEGLVGMAGKKTQETLTAADLIVEALDMAEEELKHINQHKEDKRSGVAGNFQPNIMMRGRSPSEHVLHVISAVHANDIEHTLLSLTFSDALKLISYLKEWASNTDKVELVCRIATVLLQTHHNQLISTSASKPILAALRSILHKSIKDCKDTLGFNLAAMEHIMEILSRNSDAPFREAKTKLMEIRSRQTKRQEEYAEVKDKRKSKKKKISVETQPVLAS